MGPWNYWSPGVMRPWNEWSPGVMGLLLQDLPIHSGSRLKVQTEPLMQL